MAAKVRLHEEKRYVTARISETSRYIGFGVLAIFYALVTDRDSYALALSAAHWLVLYVAGVAAVLTILADYLQYLFGAWSVNKALRRRDGKMLFDDQWWSYRLRQWCYVMKQVFACVAGAALLYLVVRGAG